MVGATGAITTTLLLASAFSAAWNVCKAIHNGHRLGVNEGHFSHHTFLHLPLIGSMQWFHTNRRPLTTSRPRSLGKYFRRLYDRGVSLSVRRAKSPLNFNRKPSGDNGDWIGMTMTKGRC